MQFTPDSVLIPEGEGIFEVMAASFFYSRNWLLNYLLVLVLKMKSEEEERYNHVMSCRRKTKGDIRVSQGLPDNI